MKFKSLNVDLSVFVKKNIIISIYVDDLLIVNLSKQIIIKVKRQLNIYFYMFD